ncbi:unnamed protein product [Closterium sp. NIES-64]|nr:unnamed protein product [Closterium sp. NIES-64]
MYAVPISDEGDCYRCFPPDPGIEATTLGASESAAPGASESAAPGAGESALSGTASAPATHTFTLNSGASRSFFRDRTTLTPLSRPVAVSLVDPSGGPVLAHFSTVLPCPAAPCGTLSGLYLPSFSTNLVSGANLQDGGVDQFTPTIPPSPSSGACPHLRSLRRRAAARCSSLLRVSSERGSAADASHGRAGPSPRPWTGSRAYFLLVVDDYSHYTAVFPLRIKREVTEVLIVWIRAARLQLRESFGSNFPVLRLHSDRGREFSSDLLRAFCRARGIRQTFTLPDSPQQNGIAERRIGTVMDVARTSMVHAAAPHFLWPFAVRYAATLPGLHAGDLPCFAVDGEGPPPVDSLPPQGPAPSGVSQVDAVDPVEVAVESGAARDAEPAGAGSGGAEPGSAEPGGADSWGAAPWGAEPGVATPGGAASGGAELGGAASGGAESEGSGPARVASGGAGPGGSSGASSRRELLSPQELREWFARRWRRAAGAGGATCAGGSAATEGAGAAGPGGARTGSTGAAGPAGVSLTGAGGAASVGATEGAGAGPAVSSGGSAGAGAAGGVGTEGASGAGASERTGVGTAGAGGAAGAGAVVQGAGAVPSGAGGAERPRPYFVPLLEQVLGLPPSASPAPPLECPPPVQSESQLQPTSPLPATSPYTGPTGGLAERREPASRPASPVRAPRTSSRGSRQRPPPVPGTHRMSLRPSTAPLRAPLPSPPESSLPVLADSESDSLRAASPTVTRLLGTAVTDPSFESAAASALVSG